MVKLHKYSELREKLMQRPDAIEKMKAARKRLKERIKKYMKEYSREYMEGTRNEKRDK
jgi:phage regulator Rha-like protein